MRLWLLVAFVLFGCLPRPSPLRAANPVPRVSAQALWRSHLLNREYDKAAQVAFEEHLGSMEIGIALRFAHLDARKRRAAYSDERYGERADALREEMEKAYEQVVKIACLYGPSRRLSPPLAVKAVRAAYADVDDNVLLYRLLDYGCPLNHTTRLEVIHAAITDDLDEYALAHALRSHLNPSDKIGIVNVYLLRGLCSFGFMAAARLSLDAKYLEPMLRTSSCEDEEFDSSGWSFSQADHRRLFFAAVKARKYHLAIEFNRLASGGESEIRYLVEEMVRRSDMYQAEPLFKLHPDLRDIVYAYALEHGRAHFVGLQTKEISWGERAFDKLLELRRYEDAAEVAEFGPSLTLRTSGILKAFRAAATAGDFIAARYLWNRYQHIVPQDEYERARAAWNRKHPRDRSFRGPRKLPKRQLDPKCASVAPDDWSVSSCN